MIEKESCPITFEILDDYSHINTPRTCYLIRKDWDDFNFKTTFDAIFITVEGKQKNLGPVSIASKNMGHGYVVLPTDHFSKLPINYCSLDTIFLRHFNLPFDRQIKGLV
ncbi:hypothetical protein [Legionella bozemanae]|uniref:Uncharacterized protein n=1 Tax=Legionella bozemanae TaxID=447 RepID=A0A0W0RC59_LEGBO|nr:hypothetical protein [Legionella bozemanae]KTC68587.1 hypothetical protein Lboz_3370 [Legionella bozemanae]STO33048.1 Uncharacterised protein [Legionella bozemanae]